MLKSISKFFSETQPKEVMSQQHSHAPELAAQLASSMEALQAVTDKLSAMSALYEAAQASLELANSAQAALVAEAAQKRMDARKGAINASIGSDKSASLLAATEGLDDKAFNAVISAMGMSFEQEAKTPLFSETGVAVKTDLPATLAEPQESEESKMLKAKYHKSK